MRDDYGIERRPDYLRCRPYRLDECWRMAWEWAYACARRDDLLSFKTDRRLRWPSPNEIASQFVLLALARLRDDHQLRLPFEEPTSGAGESCRQRGRDAQRPSSSSGAGSIPANITLGPSYVEAKADA
jgi:hypothetical protein